MERDKVHPALCSGILSSTQILSLVGTHGLSSGKVSQKDFMAVGYETGKEDWAQLFVTSHCENEEENPGKLCLCCLPQGYILQHV